MTYRPPSAREEQETVRIDVVAYNRKRQAMPSDRRSDKGLPLVLPGSLNIVQRAPATFSSLSLGFSLYPQAILVNKSFSSILTSCTCEAS